MRKFTSEVSFNEYVENHLIPEKRTFILMKDKSRQRVIWDEKKNYGAFWRKELSKTEQKCMWIFASVRRSCRKWLEDNGHVKPLEEVYSGTVKNWGRIEKLGSGETFYATDINHCYWRVAFIEGYLNEKLYIKLIPPDNVEFTPEEKEKWDVLKLFRNKSLACIKGVSETIHYKKGKLLKTVYKGEPELDVMYSDIRNKAYKIMDGARKLCGDGFLMYKTDCVYYESKYKSIVENHLAECNVMFKTNECITLDEKHFIQEDSVKGF